MFAGLQGDPSATQADAVTAARQSDHVNALAVQIQKYGAAMRQANPGVQMYVYVNGELSQSSDCSKFPASWYLYGKGGVKVKSKTIGNCAMYPLSTQTWNGYVGWMDYVAHLCQQQLAAAPLASGCFVDQISSALDSGFANTLPIDPATGALYNPATWMKQMGMIGARIQSFAGKPVIGNSYEGGSRYWGVPTNVVNGYAISGFESEHFLNAQSSDWTRLSAWTQNINMMIDGQAHGKAVHVGFTNAPGTTEGTWRQYVVASYLMGNNGNAWLAFSASTKHSFSDPSTLYKLAIGSPLQTASSVSGYAVQPGVFVRQFTSGVAVVNLSGGATTVSLGAGYIGPSGRSVTSIALANGSGMVLAK